VKRLVEIDITRRHAMSNGSRYSPEFKKETIRLVTELGQDVRTVAQDIGVHENTIYKWIQKYQENPEEPFVGSGHQRSEEAELKKANKHIADLEQEVAILKKAIAIFSRPQK
jgi:transposase